MHRYLKTQQVISNQDPISDAVGWIGFLTAKDYVYDVLTKRHGHTPFAASSRARQIIAHVQTALAFLDQAMAGPKDVSFLAAYYAVLNLMKVYVLVGPRHADLSANRLHGVSHNVFQNHQSILNEEISIKSKGVLPLFYETLTGKPFGNRPKNLKIRDVLPFIAGVGHEYRLATGRESRITTLDLSYEDFQGALRPVVTTTDDKGDASTVDSKSDLKVLRTFKVDPANAARFIGQPVSTGASRDAETRAQLRTYLLYRVFPNVAISPISSAQFEFPEEIPIALTFFYMSSVVRYRPEFFAKIRDSRFWPLLTTIRVHAFYSFLLNFWSFMQQENYFAGEHGGD